MAAIQFSPTKSISNINGEDPEAWFKSLTQGEHKALSKFTNLHRHTLFPERREALYAEQDRGFTDEELEIFFAAFQDYEWRFKVLFLFIGLTGARVGEAVRFRENQINWEEMTIKFYTEKSNTTNFQPMSEALHFLLKSYISVFRREITEASGHLFFSKNKAVKRAHVSLQWVEKLFRDIKARANLNQEPYATYQIERRRGVGKYMTVNRRRLTIHSLRYYFCEKAYQASDRHLGVTQKLMRHRSAASTLFYLKGKFSDMRATATRLKHYAMAHTIAEKAACE